MVMSAVPYDCYLPLSGSMDHHYLLQGIFRVKTTLHLNRTNVPLHPPLHNNKQGSRLVVVEAELNCTNDKLMSILCIVAKEIKGGINIKAGVTNPDLTDFLAKDSLPTADDVEKVEEDEDH